MMPGKRKVKRLGINQRKILLKKITDDTDDDRYKKYLGEVELPLSFPKINLGDFTKNKITDVFPARSISSLVFGASQSSPVACIMGNICCLPLCPLLGLKDF